MIDLARGESGVSRPSSTAALIGEPEAILLVEFAGEDSGAQSERLERLVELMGDLGLSGRRRCAITDAARRRSSCGTCARPGCNIMMSMKGDGKPVSFIEDSRGAARAPRRVHRRA